MDFIIKAIILNNTPINQPTKREDEEEKEEEGAAIILNNNSINQPTRCDN